MQLAWSRAEVVVIAEISDPAVGKVWQGKSGCDAVRQGKRKGASRWQIYQKTDEPESW